MNEVSWVPNIIAVAVAVAVYIAWIAFKRHEERLRAWMRRKTQGWLPEDEEEYGDRRNLLWAAIMGWSAIGLLALSILVLVLFWIACGDGCLEIGH